MKINSNTKLLGLIGSPIKHSLSPIMHNYVFERFKLNAVYLCFEVLEEQLKNLIGGCKAFNLKGLNVTVPYKEKIIKYLDLIDKEADIIGAVNTVKFLNNKTKGFNTDGLGFILSLKKVLGVKLNGKKVLLLGAGGAARAVSCYLAKEKISCLKIYDLDNQKTQSLVSNLRKYYKQVKFIPCTNLDSVDTKDIDILVNATPLGMKEKDPLPIPAKRLHKNMVVYDLVYNPRKTKLLKEASNKGARTINGLWMLVYQGVAALKIWFDLDFKGVEKDIYKRLDEAL